MSVGMVALGALVLALLLALGDAEAASAPTWASVKVMGSAFGVPWTEPRIAIGPDGRRWVVTNSDKPSPDQPEPPTPEAEERSGPAVVLSSTDGGTWAQTPANPTGQTVATPDVDIVAMPNGRILASELDDAGINFPTSYSDDGGKTWHQSNGTTTADQDRQWFAYGPHNRVYLLYHNLASGQANHNMFVQTSTDGGANFGPPVPITLPGSDAYTDLQCADSGGPSTIFVNQRTGVIYAEFTTRASPTPAGDAGGCGTTLSGQPFEFNIVAATRVWIAQSKDGSAGSWTNSLAVDDAPTQQIVSMQVAYAGLDTAGNVYVAYPESPEGRVYPDYGSAGVRYRYAAPADSADKMKWGAERTFVPPDTSKPGNVLVHVTIGDPGRLMAVYWQGEDQAGKEPVWHLTAAQTLDGMSANPTVTQTRVSGVPADVGTASRLMGACTTVPVIAGIINGLGCGRSPDVFGVALDNSCRTSIVWPAVDVSDDPSSTSDDKTSAPGSDPGTWVSTQKGGSTLCTTASSSSSSSSCKDTTPPKSRFTARATSRRRRSIRFKGRSSDIGCLGANGVRKAGRVAFVNVTVAKVRGKGKRRRCAFLQASGRLTRYRSCRKTVRFRAAGTRRWSLTRTVRLPRGRYQANVRGRDSARNYEPPRRRGNTIYFRVR